MEEIVVLLERIFSYDLIRKAAGGKIYRFVACGVDLYLPELDDEDIALDISRPCEFSSEKFFSNRYFQLVDLLNQDEHLTFSNTQELLDYMKQQNLPGVGLIPADVLAFDDVNEAYVLTPLSESELEFILAG